MFYCFKEGIRKSRMKNLLCDGTMTSTRIRRNRSTKPVTPASKRLSGRTEHAHHQILKFFSDKGSHRVRYGFDISGNAIHDLLKFRQWWTNTCRFHHFFCSLSSSRGKLISRLDVKMFASINLVDYLGHTTFFLGFTSVKWTQLTQSLLRRFQLSSH